jgi:hypothetical protein
MHQMATDNGQVAPASAPVYRLRGRLPDLLDEIAEELGTFPGDSVYSLLKTLATVAHDSGYDAAMVKLHEFLSRR